MLILGGLMWEQRQVPLRTSGRSGVVPFLLRTALEQRGGRHSGAAIYTRNVVVDERLVTGHNPKF